MLTEAARHLQWHDPVLRPIIRAVGPCRLPKRYPYFPALCDAIISQQVSAKAADSMIRRFRELFPRKRPGPPALLALTDDRLRAAGMSRQKIGYLRDLARKFDDGSLPHRRLGRMTDEGVIEALSRVKGIGVWTGQMFLIFVLHRPDVLPVLDLGLRKGVQRAYNLPELPDADTLHTIAAPWRPFRSVATWYMWRSLALP